MELAKNTKQKNFWSYILLFLLSASLTIFPLILNPGLKYRFDSLLHQGLYNSLQNPAIQGTNPFLAEQILFYPLGWEYLLLFTNKITSLSYWTISCIYFVVIAGFIPVIIMKTTSYIKNDNFHIENSGLLSIFGLNLFGWILFIGLLYQKTWTDLLDYYDPTFAVISLGFDSRLSFFYQKFYVGNSFPLAVLFYVLCLFLLVKICKNEKSSIVDILASSILLSIFALLTTILQYQTAISLYPSVFFSTILIIFSKYKKELWKNIKPLFAILFPLGISAGLTLIHFLNLANLIEQQTMIFPFTNEWSLENTTLTNWLSLFGLSLFVLPAIKKINWKETHYLIILIFLLINFILSTIIFPGNNQYKFVYLSLFPLSILGAEGISQIKYQIKHGQILYFLRFPVFMLTTILCSIYISQTSTLPSPSPSEIEFSTWATSTEVDSVFIDTRENQTFPVPSLVGRSSYLSFFETMELWGYSKELISNRILLINQNLITPLTDIEDLTSSHIYLLTDSPKEYYHNIVFHSENIYVYDIIND